jgi:hypothetical protein
MDLEALAVNVGDLKGKCLVEPQSQARDGGKGALMVQRGGGLEETPNFFKTEDGGETVCGLSPNQSQRVPITLKDMMREESDATGADAHGSWGKAIDVCAVQAGGLKLLFGEQVWRCARELSQQADLTDIRFLSPFSLTTELEGGHHVLTQGGHEMSPFVS